MKLLESLSLICLLPLTFSCNNQPNNSQQLQAHIDRLEKKLATTYKPGLGEG